MDGTRDDRDLITRLGQAKLGAVEAALGASIMQSKPVIEALRQGEWQIFLAIQSLEEDRRVAAEHIWQDLSETLSSNEHAVALPVRMRELRSAAVNLLARPVRPRPPTPPLPPTQVPPVAPPPPELPLRGAVPNWAGSDLAEVEAFYGGDRARIERNRRLVAELKNRYGRSQVEADDLPAWLTAEAAASLLEVHLIRGLTAGGPDEPNNMIVLTPTLHALVHLDAGTVIDLSRRILELPKFGLRVKIQVAANHGG